MTAPKNQAPEGAHAPDATHPDWNRFLQAGADMPTLPDAAPSPAEGDTVLVDALRKAHQLCEWLIDKPSRHGSINGLAAQVRHDAAKALARHDALASKAQPKAAEAPTGDDWARTIAPLMPADFKDWHENSPREWPRVTAEIIKALRESEAFWIEQAGHPQPKGTPGVLRQHSTIYVLNERGTNRWWASVQSGHDDDDRRVSDAECEAVAEAIRTALAGIPSLPSPAPEDATGGTHGRRNGLRSAVHGRVAVGGHTPGALADLLFASHDVMSLNAELDLTMEQLVQLTQAVLTAIPSPAVPHGKEQPK